MNIIAISDIIFFHSFLKVNGSSLIDKFFDKIRLNSQIWTYSLAKSHKCFTIVDCKVQAEAAEGCYFNIQISMAFLFD